MNKFSKIIGFSAVAGLGLATALVLAPAGRAAVSPAPGLSVSHTTADLDHALGAFDAFRNRLDQAPRPVEGARQVAAVEGERAVPTDCARHTWPHIPAACQTSAEGRPARQVRTVTTDAAR